MEGVLRLYSEEEKQGVARLCLDERPCRLLSEVMMLLPIKPGMAKRIDNEYKREGTCALLSVYDVEKGTRYAEVREQRTKRDCAAFVDKIITEHYAEASKVKLVQDNLHIHTKGAFYEHLPVQRAGEPSELIDFVYTPKHGSWLNMAEIEFSALARQCLDRRTGRMEQLKQLVEQWTAQRNEDKTKIHWSFTVETARDKLASQYQKVNDKNYIDEALASRLFTNC